MGLRFGAHFSLFLKRVDFYFTSNVLEFLIRNTVVFGALY